MSRTRRTTACDAGFAPHGHPRPAIAKTPLHRVDTYLAAFSDGFEESSDLFGIGRIYAGEGPLRVSCIRHAGIVVIEEMELHLHPAWQQKISFWLKRHFPNADSLFLVAFWSRLHYRCAEMTPTAPLSDALYLPPSTYRRMRWKNGAGWTTEIALEPGHDGEFAWRISIADIDADNDFSTFPGVDRTILVLSGGGMVLDVAGHPAQHLLPLKNAFAFPGETAIRARLASGPTRDFNVMTRRAAYQHQLAIYPFGTSSPVTRNEQTAVFVYILEGTLWGAAMGDSWLLPRGPAARLDLPADASLIVVRLQSQ